MKDYRYFPVHGHRDIATTISPPITNVNSMFAEAEKAIDLKFYIFDNSDTVDKSSAVAEMGDHDHNRHGPKRGGCCAPFAERWEPV